MQLGTGTGTSYNVTINLTGHILLAIGIATSLLIYMLLNSMSNEGSYGGGGDGYDSPSTGYGSRYGNYKFRRVVNKVLFIGKQTLFTPLAYAHFFAQILHRMTAKFSIESLPSAYISVNSFASILIASSRMMFFYDTSYFSVYSALKIQ